MSECVCVCVCVCVCMTFEEGDRLSPYESACWHPLVLCAREPLLMHGVCVCA